MGRGKRVDGPSPIFGEGAARLKGETQHRGAGGAWCIADPSPQQSWSWGEQRPKASQGRWAVADAALWAPSALGTWIRVAVTFS